MQKNIRKLVESEHDIKSAYASKRPMCCVYRFLRVPEDMTGQKIASGQNMFKIQIPHQQILYENPTSAPHFTIMISLAVTVMTAGQIYLRAHSLNYSQVNLACMRASDLVACPSNHGVPKDDPLKQRHFHPICDHVVSYEEIMRSGTNTWGWDHRVQPCLTNDTKAPRQLHETHAGHHCSVQENGEEK